MSIRFDAGVQVGKSSRDTLLLSIVSSSCRTSRSDDGSLGEIDRQTSITIWPDDKVNKIRNQRSVFLVVIGLGSYANNVAER